MAESGRFKNSSHFLNTLIKIAEKNIEIKNEHFNKI